MYKKTRIYLQSTIADNKKCIFKIHKEKDIHSI